jgi:hypothetical protein
MAFPIAILVQQENKTMNMYQGNDQAPQVNWLNQVAADIVAADMSDGQTSAEDLVEFWEQDAEKPDGFDINDRRYLVERVSEEIANTAAFHPHPPGANPIL